jgi:hypothetical protein
MNAKNIGLITSCIFAVAVFAFFVMSWQDVQKASAVDEISVEEQYKKVEIESVRTTATKLLSDRTNAANLPIVAPSGKTGTRANPFDQL